MLARFPAPECRVRHRGGARVWDLISVGGGGGGHTRIVGRSGPVLTTTLLISALTAGGNDGSPRLVARLLRENPIIDEGGA